MNRPSTWAIIRLKCEFDLGRVDCTFVPLNLVTPAKHNPLKIVIAMVLRMITLIWDFGYKVLLTLLRGTPIKSAIENEKHPLFIYRKVSARPYIHEKHTVYPFDTFFFNTGAKPVIWGVTPPPPGIRQSEVHVKKEMLMLPQLIVPSKQIKSISHTLLYFRFRILDQFFVL